VRALNDIIDDISLGILCLDEAVTELADDDRLDDIAALIEWRVALPRDEAFASLTDSNELPTALVCKTAGLSANGYSAVLRMRRRLRRDLESVPAPLLGAYPEIPRPRVDELRRQLPALLVPGSQ
jgi:hypothetical protein